MYVCCVCVCVCVCVCMCVCLHVWYEGEPQLCACRADALILNCDSSLFTSLYVIHLENPYLRKVDSILGIDVGSRITWSCGLAITTV